MGLQKIATYGTAVAVVGTGSVVGGVKVVDQQTGGPQKRMEAEATELRMIVREEVRAAFKEAWPTSTGTVKGLRSKPSQDYRTNTPPRQ